MKINCEKIAEKILFFDELDAKEQSDIQEHLDICSACRRLSTEYARLSEGLKQVADSRHFSDDTLFRWVLHTYMPGEPDIDGQKINEEQARDIAAHVADCPRCSARTEAMQTELEEMDTFLKEAGIPDMVIGKPGWREQLDARLQPLRQWWGKAFASPRRQWVPALVTVAAVVTILIFSPIFRQTGNPYFKLAKLEPRRLTHITRSSTDHLLTSALNQFNRENFLEAASQLETYLLASPDPQTAAYAEYVCGLAYLMEVNQNLSNRMKDPQSRQIERGKFHLNAAAGQTQSRRIREDAYWYLAKAHLMEKDAQAARAVLQQVVQLKGRRAAAARELKQQIQKTLISID